MRCTVVVVNFNGAEFVGECLESLVRQSAPGLQVQLVVVDNASSDGSPELIQRLFPEVTLVRSPVNLGFGGGVNLAISRTRGEVVVLVNNDAVADPGFLAAITGSFIGDGPGAGSTAAADERLAAVTGLIVLAGRFVPAPGDPGAYVSAAGLRWSRVVDDAADEGIELVNSTGSQLSRSGNARDRSWLSPSAEVDDPPTVFGFCGGAVALRRAALEAVGTFDERLFMYYEDVDLSWRLRRAGWEIRFAADAVVRHRHAASSGIRTRLFLIHNVRNRVLVVARNGPAVMLAAALGRTVGNVVKSGLRSLTARDGGDARRQALAGVAAIGQLLWMLPRFLADGRRTDAHAAQPRSFIHRWTLPD